MSSINPNNKLHNIVDARREMLDHLFKLGKMYSIPKGKSILREGDKVDFIFFVIKGCFRAYRWKEEEEITIGFSFEGDIDTCPYAYIHHKPSSDTIEAITNSEVLKIFRSDIIQLGQSIPEIQEFSQQMLADYIETLIQRIVDLKTESAETLYKKLFERQPDQVSIIPLMHIASYLGVSRERLSRIRKKFKPN